MPGTAGPRRTRIGPCRACSAPLTDDGEAHPRGPRCALERPRKAELELAARRAEPIGRVRLDLPAGFGRLLLPALSNLRQRHPKITLEVALTDRMSDPVGDGWDIVVRIGTLPPDCGMTVRRLCDLRFGHYASPEYPARQGPVNTVADLAGQDVIIFRGSSGRLRPRTVWDGGMVRDLVPLPGAGPVGRPGSAGIHPRRHGHHPDLDRIARPCVKAGRLPPVLPAADIDGPPVLALIPLDDRMPAKTRVVLDHPGDSPKPSGSQREPP